MPVENPSSGRAFIWLISCFLFLTILAGGVCLMAYLVLPESQVAPWLPTAGITLVCLPWAFWILTFIYRIISRACGFRGRVGYGDGGGGGNGGGGNNGGGDGGAAKFKNAAPVDVEASGAQANGGAAAVGGGQGNGGGLDRNLSVASHESEMPLKVSMAS